MGDNKILYISKAFKDNVSATMHYEAIKEIFGADNVITIDLRPISPRREERYIAYGKYKNIFERIKRWAQGNMMFLSNKIIAEICNIIKANAIKTVFIEDSVFGNLVKRIKKICPDVSVVTFYHDIKAVLYPYWIKTAKGRHRIIDRIEYSIGIKQEKINQKYSDTNIVFNQRDADLYEKIYKAKPDKIIALAVPVPKTRLEPDSSFDGTLKLLFVGKRYQPNINGLKWFTNKVLPHLPENIEVQIVGRGLEYLKNKNTDHRVNVIGGVPSLTPYYENADMVIVPLFEGGGMKIKTAEATSFGKCFLGTKESLFGYWEELGDEVRNKIVYSYENPQEWIDCISEFAKNPPKKFYKEIYDIFLLNFSYDAVLEKLRECLLPA